MPHLSSLAVANVRKTSLSARSNSHRFRSCLRENAGNHFHSRNRKK